MQPNQAEEKSFLYFWKDIGLHDQRKDHYIGVIANSIETAINIVDKHDQFHEYAMHLWQNPEKTLTLNKTVPTKILFWG